MIKYRYCIDTGTEDGNGLVFFRTYRDVRSYVLSSADGRFFLYKRIPKIRRRGFLNCDALCQDFKRESFLRKQASELNFRKPLNYCYFPDCED